MFDISWSEFLLIGVVALIVIGPKELPAVMRTLGQWTRKVRGMASDFQNQFQEAMREAEMTDLKKEVDDLAHGIRNFDPLKDVREHVESTGEVVKQSLASASEPAAALAEAAAEPALTETPTETPPASFEAAAVPAAEAPAAATAVTPMPVEAATVPAAETPAPAPPEPAEPPVREMETIGAGAPTDAAEPSGKAAPDDGTGRTG